MLSTFELAGLIGGLFVLQVILWAIFLRLGLRWAKVPDITIRRFGVTKCDAGLAGRVGECLPRIWAVRC